MTGNRKSMGRKLFSQIAKTDPNISRSLPQIAAIWTQAQYGVVYAQPNETARALDWVHGEDW